MKEKIKYNDLEQNQRTDLYYPIELEPSAKDFKPEKEQEEIKDSNNNNKNLE